MPTDPALAAIWMAPVEAVSAMSPVVAVVLWPVPTSTVCAVPTLIDWLVPIVND